MDKSRDQSKKNEEHENQITARASVYLTDLKKACDEYRGKTTVLF